MGSSLTWHGISRSLTALNAVTVQTNQLKVQQLLTSNGSLQRVWQAALTTDIIWLQAKPI